jgi:hypothetical protein
LSSILATLWLTYSLPLSAWKPRISNGNCSSICSITGSRCASEMVCTLATTCHWVTQSTALMWYSPLMPSWSPWCTLSMRMKPGAALGCRCLRTPMSRRRVGLVLVSTTRWAVARAVAQVVQVPDRDVAQSLEAWGLEHVALAAQHAGRGGSGQRSHGPVHLGQQRHVSGRVVPRKGVLGPAVVLHQRLGRHPAGHQPRHLRAAVAAEVLQVGQHRALVRTGELAVAKPAQHLLDPAVASLVILGPPELQRLGPGHDLAHLLERAHLCFIHVDHHRFDDRPPR